MDKIKELQKDQVRKEVIIDASGQTIGRVASKVAFLLQGKASADYEPRKIGNTIVTVLNIRETKVTGKKLKDKMYYRWTGYIGNNKQFSLKDKLDKDIVKTFREMVRGMLPKNTLRDKRLKNLIVK